MRPGSFLENEAFWTPDLWRRVETRYPRDAQMLRLYWESSLTLRGVAARFGTSEARVRQRILRAFAFGKRCAAVWTPERQWHELQAEACIQAVEAALRRGDGLP